MPEILDGNSVMYRTVNWQEEIEVIAGPFSPAKDTRESWLSRAARKSQVTCRHIKALWYGELTDPRFSIAKKVLSAADRARIEGAKRDGAKVANIYNSMARALENVDPDFHRDQINALVTAARLLGHLDSA